MLRFFIVLSRTAAGDHLPAAVALAACSGLSGRPRSEGDRCMARGGGGDYAVGRNPKCGEMRAS